MARLRLEWPLNPPADLVTAYQVLESQDGGAFAVKAQVEAPTNFLEFNTAPVVYQWKIRPLNFVGAGPDSDVVNGPGLPSKAGTPVVTVVPPAP